MNRRTPFGSLGRYSVREPAEIRAEVREAIELTDGVLSKAAWHLDVSRKQVYRFANALDLWPEIYAARARAIANDEERRRPMLGSDLWRA